MSKARLVITAVVTEGRSQGEVARSYGVSQGWVSRLAARYRAEGEAAYEPRSRRPHRSPGAISDEVAGLIIALRKDLAGQGLDAGPHTICWHLHHRHQVTVSAATVSRYLTRAGLVTPDPAKRPRSSYLRFAAELPNQCWQSDFTNHPQTQGKIERFWQTLKKWLAAQPRPATLTELQSLLDTFTSYYNTLRPSPGILMLLRIVA